MNIAIAGLLVLAAVLILYGGWVVNEALCNPKSRHYGRRWCWKKGFRYRETKDQETGRYVWWGEDERGRHYRYGRN